MRRGDMGRGHLTNRFLPVADWLAAMQSLTEAIAEVAAPSLSPSNDPMSGGGPPPPHTPRLFFFSFFLRSLVRSFNLFLRLERYFYLSSRRRLGRPPAPSPTGPSSTSSPSLSTLPRRAKTRARRR